MFTFVNANADNATGVTYNGITVPVVSGGRAVDTATEAGDCKAWFLGVNVPSGAQTVAVTRTNNANVMYAVAVTVTASLPLGVRGIVLLQENQTLAEQSVDDGSPGTNSLRYAGLNSGITAFPSQGANSTALVSIAFGARSAGVVRETTAGQGSRSVGFSSATNDDVAAVHLAIYEIAAFVATQWLRKGRRRRRLKI